jgi:hypothetical protein
MADFACNHIHFRHNVGLRTSTAAAAAASSLETCTSSGGEDRESVYVQLLTDIITASAHLAAAWQVH